MPTSGDLLQIFENVLFTSVDLQSLVWCIVNLRRLFPVSSTASHHYTDSLLIESLVKGDVMRRCHHLPPALAGDFSSPSADALCQIDIIAFILMAAARVEMSLPENNEFEILPPFLSNTLTNTEIGGETVWLTASQNQWWRVVISPPSRLSGQQTQSDPFAKFRLIQDGLFLLRLSGLDAKLTRLAIRVAEALQSFVLENYFALVHSNYQNTLPSDIRRYHVYCTKYWDSLLQFIQSSRSTSMSHHSQRVSLGGSATPPSRQQRFFEPFLGLQLGTGLTSELKTRITLLANLQLGFDAYLNGSNESSVKLLKTCSSDLTLAAFFEGRAYEAMADEAAEKSNRTGSSSSWVLRQLYESALASYEKAIGYTQTSMQQVQRAYVVEVASTSASRMKKALLGSSVKSEPTSHLQRAVTLPVNGESLPIADAPPQVSISQKQFEAFQQQQEQFMTMLNTTVNQLVPTMKELASAARSFADIGLQLKDCERQVRESVVRLECLVQQQQQLQQQRPASTAASTPPVTSTSSGTITAEQLLPLMMEMINKDRAPPQSYMSPNVPAPILRQFPDQIPVAPPVGMMQPPPQLPMSMAPPPQMKPVEQGAWCAGGQQPFKPIPNVPLANQPPPLFAQQVPRATTPVSAPLFNQPIKQEPQQPPVQQPPKPTGGPAQSLSDMFKPQAGSWSCDTCLVRNKESDIKCVACETLRPGAKQPEPQQKPPQISFGFGTSPSPAANKPQASPAPIFGGGALFPKPTGDTSSIQFGSPSGASPFGTKATPTGSNAPTATTPLFGKVTTPVSTAPSIIPAAPQPAKPEGTGTLFGAFTAPKPNEKVEAAKPPPATTGAEGGEGGEEESPEEFVPTAEYNPVAQLPSNYQVVTGEEDEERLFSERAKLYRWAEEPKEWKERGLGEMKVLRNKVTNKCRILMRREQVLKPCANHYITPDFKLRPFQAVGDKGFCWVAADFAECEPGEPPQVMKLAIRFKTPEQAIAFKKAVEQCVSTAPPASPEKPTSKPAPKQEETKKPEQKPLFSVPTTATPTGPSTTTSAPVFGSTFGSLAANTTSTSTAPVFGSTFGSMAANTTPGSTTSAFGSFAALAAASPKNGDESKNATSDLPKPQPLFKNLMSKPAENQIQDGDDGNEPEPDEFVPDQEYKPVCQLPSDYQVSTGEEGFEKVFSERCKLYRWDGGSGEWKERGLGDIRLLRASDNSGKHRIVMRREHIHTVCANHYLTISPSMKLGRLPSAADKACTWFTPCDYSDGEQKMETLCARFKTPALADLFTKKFSDALAELEAKHGSGDSPKENSKRN